MTSQKPALPLDRARVRALLFDVDGTLSDSDDHMVSRFAGKLSFLDGLLSRDLRIAWHARSCILLKVQETGCSKWLIV